FCCTVAFFWLHIFGARWIYSGVPRVAAGGRSKTRNPAGRNSGATLCYAFPGSRTTASLRMTHSLSLQISSCFARL
ncbi:MAG: hypothetical protein ACK50J_30405, partial [Planctomyces sp.]